MTTLEIVLTVVLAVIALVLIIFYGIRAVKSGLVSKVYDSIVVAMKEAEKLQLSGEDKKKYVLEQVQNTCKADGIPYDFIAKLVSKVIENVIKGYNSMVK